MTCILFSLKIMSASRLAVVRYFKKRLQSVLCTIVERFVACVQVQKEKGAKQEKGDIFPFPPPCFHHCRRLTLPTSDAARSVVLVKAHIKRRSQLFD